MYTAIYGTGLFPDSKAKLAAIRPKQRKNAQKRPIFGRIAPTAIKTRKAIYGGRRPLTLPPGDGLHELPRQKLNGDSNLFKVYIE